MFVLKDLISRIEEYVEDNIEESNEEQDKCPNCKKDLSMLGDSISFCPFCGEEIK